MLSSVSSCSSIQARMSRTIRAGSRVGRQPKSTSALCAVGHVDPEVHARRLGDRRDRDSLAGLLDAESGQLPERDRPIVAAADVVDPAVPPLRRFELKLEQVEEVVHVKDVADLLALAAKPGITQRAPEVMASDPERDHALVNLAHLPGAGDDATTVDQSRACRS